jgi:hypothetical protein
MASVAGKRKADETPTAASAKKSTSGAVVSEPSQLELKHGIAVRPFGRNDPMPQVRGFRTINVSSMKWSQNQQRVHAGRHLSPFYLGFPFSFFQIGPNQQRQCVKATSFERAWQSLKVHKDEWDAERKRPTQLFWDRQAKFIANPDPKGARRKLPKNPKNPIIGVWYADKLMDRAEGRKEFYVASYKILVCNNIKHRSLDQSIDWLAKLYELVDRGEKICIAGPDGRQLHDDWDWEKELQSDLPFGHELVLAQMLIERKNRIETV